MPQDFRSDAQYWNRIALSAVLLLSWGLWTPSVRAAEPTDSSPIWEAGVGEGFKKGAMEFGLAAGPGLGMAVLTSPQAHDWVLGTAQIGWMISRTLAPEHWYRGNFEFLVEGFGAWQYRPDDAYAVGAAPMLRYNLAAGHRWVPFVDFGAGVTATDIRNGDLSTTFEFNLQSGVGVHYFLKDNLSLSVQYRFVHLSNAGIEFPNLGVNTSNFLIGVSWFF